MNNYIITSDTTCDLPDSYVAEHGIDIIPLYYRMNDVIYGEENTMTPSDFYNEMRNGKMPTTMACNPETAEKHFRKYLEQGLDILHIAFSSELSSSYNTAAITARELASEYPDNKIIVIDSRAASMGEGLMVYKAICNRDNGMNIDDNAKWVEDNKLHFCHQFTVDDLHHLHRGGRVSKATAIIGTMINVKPVLHVDDEGRLIPLSNVRGRKKALNTLIDNMEETMKGYDNDIVFISHGDCLDDAIYVSDKIKERFGIDKFMINYVCPTVGAHSGPGTLALFFMGDKR
jgi:DegV family protein with EDD domain